MDWFLSDRDLRHEMFKPLVIFTIKCPENTFSCIAQKLKYSITDFFKKHGEIRIYHNSLS